MTGVNLNDTLRTGNTAIAIVKGDVNGSGRKSISRLTALARMLIDPAQFTGAQQLA